MRAAFIVIVGLFVGSFVGVVQAQSFDVGAGAVAVTPAAGSYLAGYGADRRSTGSLDPVWVKVVVIKTGAERLAILTVDCIGLTRPDILRIEAGVLRSLPGTHVVVSSTHTHAGPDVVGIWGPAMWRSGRDEDYIDGLVETAIALVIETDQATQTATSRVASVDAPMSWVENVSEKELLDSRMAVLQFVSSTGETLATLTNFACHPTVLGPDNTLVSADYVHGFYRHMAAKLSGEHLFLQGAIGGWVQPVQGDRSHSLALELGESLANVALKALMTADENVYAPLLFETVELDVPLDNWGFRLLIWLGVLERELHAGAMRTSVVWFKVGQAEFVTHPGETSPAYSLASRSLLNARHSFVMGLTQDAMGYILKPEYFAEDVSYPHAEYLTSVSVGVEAGPRVMAALEEIVP